jgi:hypothetical protein
VPADLRRVVLDEVGQRLAQVVDVREHAAQHFGRAGIVQQGQQQVLHGDELVALLPASTNAMWRLTSSSWAIMRFPFALLAS